MIKLHKTTQVSEVRNIIEDVSTKKYHTENNTRYYYHYYTISGDKYTCIHINNLHRFFSSYIYCNI